MTQRAHAGKCICTCACTYVCMFVCLLGVFPRVWIAARFPGKEKYQVWYPKLAPTETASRYGSWDRMCICLGHVHEADRLCAGVVLWAIRCVFTTRATHISGLKSGYGSLRVPHVLIARTRSLVGPGSDMAAGWQRGGPGAHEFGKHSCFLVHMFVKAEVRLAIYIDLCM